MQIYAHNLSSVFGGQERYLELLAQVLDARGYALTVKGGPERLCARPAKPAAGPVIELLNGNRALYHRGWRSRQADLRIYVQHSSLLDGQGARWRRWLRKALFRILLRRMDAVIRVCDASLPNSYAPGRIFTVHNGVTLPDIPQVVVKMDALTLLMVGAVNDNKNQLLALKALCSCDHVRLIIVGDGPRCAAWKSWATASGIADRVTWAGFTADPSPYYRQADALLMLSKFEAFPYAVLEAMSFGLPVIATPAGGVAEVTRHNQNGILLDGWDQWGLVQAITRIEQDPTLRHCLGTNARATIRNQFTLDHMADGFLRVVRHAAERRGVAL